MINFPKIGQFRQVIKHVAFSTAFISSDKCDQPILDSSITKPCIKYRGTVKLHGTNAAIVICPNGKIKIQSRKREITLTRDNHGFAAFSLGIVGEDTWRNLAKTLLIKLQVDSHNQPVTIYGEFCGGNIQTGVALKHLPKMFVIFGLRIGTEDSTKWVDIHEAGDLKLDEKRVYSISDSRFPTYEIDIDFENPALVRNEINSSRNSFRCK